MDQLHLGIIGVSGRGGMARHWQDNPRAEVVAGMDVNSDALADFQERMGNQPFVTTDLEALLNRDDVEAVGVFSPDFTHEEYAVAALEAGKHVFCEKPLAITTEGCDRILRAWKASGKRLMVGFNMRYMNIFRVMKEVIDSGAIGEPKAAWCRHFVGHGGWFYYHDWHARVDGTNSLLLQKGSHDLDMLHWLTGSYTQRVAAFGSLDFFGGGQPNDLTCPECERARDCPEYIEWPDHEKCVFRQEVEVEDNQVMIMELENGIKASYLQCHFTPDYHRNYTIIGTEGRVENSEPEMKVWVKTRRSRHDWKALADRTYDVKPAEGGHGGADPVITQDFLDMVLDGKEPLATPVAGRMSVAAGCAGAQSLRQGGGVVEIPPLAW
ncbi:MAG: Gfo/Idh/MocA family oxidoreductase [candidate division WS1 bacterium]|jgi:predicted dehydrogenase|nr:Gfo/Idh/MocA family oxidoreductase [candidate division WS1 bacterium]